MLRLVEQDRLTIGHGRMEEASRAPAGGPVSGEGVVERCVLGSG